MPKGKGYFWPGLAQGVAGLYGHTQNERMQDQSQAFRAEEGKKDREQRQSQFDTMFAKPPADTLNPDLDSAIKLAADADDNLQAATKAYGTALTMNDPKGITQAESNLRNAKFARERAQAAAQALQGKTLARQGAKAVVDAPKEPKKMGLMEQYLANRKNQVK